MQAIMDMSTPAWLLLVPFAALLTALACRWWYRRRLRRFEHRIGKLHAERETLHDQLKRGRQQLGQVQKDLSTWRQAVATAAQRRPPAAAAASVRLAAQIPSGLVFEAPPLAANGFADTQPFEGETPA